MPRLKGARGVDYPEKRAALLRKMSARMARLNDTRPSLRQLAEAAEVTVPTLRHYFGSRDQIVEAVFAEYRRLGDRFVQDAAEPKGPFRDSMREFVNSLMRGMQGPLGNIFAVGFVEGMLNNTLGPACLADIVDPAVDALTRRLEAHQARGDMRPANPRHAALMLLSPLLIACQHQTQMFGQASRPLPLSDLAEDVLAGFLAAFEQPDAI